MTAISGRGYLFLLWASRIPQCNAGLRPFWHSESDECEWMPWMPVIATGPQVWHPARDGPGPNSFPGVYINDLPQSIPSECSICADDTSMFKTGRTSQLICSRISEDLSCATDWATVWGMQFNAEKSEHLIISTKWNNTSKQRVLMDNRQIPQVTSHKHLGIYFNDTLSWQKHMPRSTHHAPNKLAWWSEMEIFACCPEKDLYRHSPA